MIFRLVLSILITLVHLQGTHGNSVCNYLTTLSDNGKDGWNGNYISIAVGAEEIALTDTEGSFFVGTKRTLDFGASKTFGFSVRDGDIVSVTYKPFGKYHSENAFEIRLAGSHFSPIVSQGIGNATTSTTQYTAQCCCAPSQVTNVQLLPNEQFSYLATLKWDPTETALAYIVRRQVNNGSFQFFGEYTKTQLPIFVEPSQTYIFTISALNNVMEGIASEPLTITPITYSTCELDVRLYDSYGDGWLEGNLGIYLNNALTFLGACQGMRSSFKLQVPVEGDFNVRLLLDNPLFLEDVEYTLSFNHHKLFQFKSEADSDSTLNVSCTALQSHSDEPQPTSENLLVNRDGKPKSLLSQTGPQPKNLDPFIIHDLLDPISNRSRSLQAAVCVYDLRMFDWFQDGWVNGSMLSVTVFGNIVQTGLIVPPGQRSIDWYFQVPTGTPVGFIYTKGNDPKPTDASYVVFSYNVATKTLGTDYLVESPPGLDQFVIPGNTSFVANCGCPTNCKTLNRQDCQDAWGLSVCGPCKSGFSVTDGTAAKNGTSICIAMTTVAPTPAPTPPPNLCDTLKPCNTNAYCTPTQGSYTCTCNSGYTGNGATCQPIQGCPTVRVRREWFDLTVQERDRFVRAVRALYARATTPGSSNDYIAFSDQHNTYQGSTHLFPLFLYWHRVFLYNFESALRSLGGEFECITIPYWDWTNNDYTTVMTNFFTNVKSSGYWTGTGIRSTQCFSATAHPYSGFVNGGGCVYRGAPTAPLSQPTIYTMGSALSTNMFSVAWPTLEAYHNSIHQWVGGIMNYIGLSASDPVFYHHHSMVDMVWAAWQNCNGQSSVNRDMLYNTDVRYVWDLNSPVGFYDNMPGITLRGAAVKAKDAFDLLDTFQVKYSLTWVNRAFGQPIGYCPKTGFPWMVQSVKTNHSKHLMAAKKSNSNSKKLRPLRGKFKPPADVVAMAKTLHETYKDFLLATNDERGALEAALEKSCSILPLETNGARFLSEFTINQTHFHQRCASGFCTGECWKRTIGKRS